MKIEELYGKDYVFVDVRSPSEFLEDHIPGAINIPTDDLNSVAPKLLKKNDTIVVYCASYTCHASTNAAKILLKMGYKKVLDFKAGKKGWLDAGIGLER